MASNFEDTGLSEQVKIDVQGCCFFFGSLSLRKGNSILIRFFIFARKKKEIADLGLDDVALQWEALDVEQFEQELDQALQVKTF